MVQENMRKVLSLVIWTALACSAQTRPRIRAVTAFIEIDANNYAAKVEEAQKFLARAREALNAAGFEGAGGRITTQPFPAYTRGMKREDALALIRKLREAASKGRTGLNIGPAMLHDDDDTAPVSLLADILSEVSVNANLVIADERGIHWRAVEQAARLIHDVGERSPHGDGNFNFGAIAMMKPYGPYYPGSYHLGKGRAFAIAMEGAGVVTEIFTKYKTAPEAEQHLAEALSKFTREAEAVATKVAAESGWTYEGIDATPAPGGSNSIGGAIEAFLGEPFGSSGTLTASGIITRAVQATPVKAHGLLRPDDPRDGRSGAREAVGRRHVPPRFDPGVFGGVRRRRGHRAAARGRHAGTDRAHFGRRGVARLPLEQTARGEASALARQACWR
jgi:uncharacterized protein (UPF0210 family)